MDKPVRYSDEVPYEKRRYWYFTLHGLGPGTIPTDLHVLETREGRNDKGTLGLYVCLDGVLNTSELKTYDLRELAPPEEEKSEEEIIEDYLRENGLYTNEIWKDHDGIHIYIENGDWKHSHLFCKELMEELGYTQVFYKTKPYEDENIIWDDCQTAEHCYIKN